MSEMNIKRLEVSRLGVMTAKGNLELSLMELLEKVEKAKKNIELQDKELASLDEKIKNLREG